MSAGITQVKVLAVKPDGLSINSGIYVVVEGERELHTYCGWYMR